ncbi:glycoside hydrolase family protein [Echinicola salinicaeni]|uniref:hypothetical protein n=1 Tax=Echinicola salinicaeni TaxID=2762757 RepID=UPI001646BF83|nr:hypothetical protein [Echinicola salinicaeni]
MDIPSLSSFNLRHFWAPDIVKGKDEKYYLYFGNCQAGCNIYGYVADMPLGPWKKLNEDDTPIISPEMGFLLKIFIFQKSPTTENFQVV